MGATNSDKLADQLPEQDERYSLEQETGILTIRVASGKMAVGRGARARSSERLDFSPGWTRPRWFVVTEGGPLSRGDGSIAKKMMKAPDKIHEAARGERGARERLA